MNPLRSPDTITSAYLTREISSALSQGPIAYAKKVEQISKRVLEELSYKEIKQLNKVVQSTTPHSGQMSEHLTISTIQKMLESLKNAKRELDKLKNAMTCIENDQLDEAVTILDTVDDTFQEKVKELRNTVAIIYRENGENAKADKILGIQTKPIIKETPAEIATCDAGINLMKQGMNNLRSVLPGNLPSNNQMEDAMRGLRQMSLSSAGRTDISDLENDSIEILQAKLKTEESNYVVARENLNRAFETKNPIIFMPVMKKKQSIANEIIRIKVALDKKGVSQKEDVNVEELFTQTFKNSLNEARNNFKQQLNYEGDDEEEKNDCLIM